MSPSPSCHRWVTPAIHSPSENNLLSTLKLHPPSAITPSNHPSRRPSGPTLPTSPAPLPTRHTPPPSSPTYAVHANRSEPPLASDHLLRLYRPQSTGEEALPEGGTLTETEAPLPEEPDSASPTSMPTPQVTSLHADHAGASLLSLPPRTR